MPQIGRMKGISQGRLSRKLPQRRGALSLKEEWGVRGLRQLGEAEQEEHRGLRRLKSRARTTWGEPCWGDLDVR